MNKQKRVIYPPAQMGTSFLLVVLIVLCLVVFAALSLSGALRDKSYSDKLADHTTAYYEATSEANHILGDVYKAASSGNASQSLKSLKDVSVESVSADLLTVSYTVPVQNAQVLSVALQVNTSKKTVKVIKWKEITSSEWKGSTSLPVLKLD